MGRRKPHHPTKTRASARAYLDHELGAEQAAQLLEVAEKAAATLDDSPAALSTKDRRLAARLAARLRPLVVRGSPKTVAAVDDLLRKWNAQARPGQRRGRAYNFAFLFLWVADNCGLPKVTETQLMAFAVATGIEPASEQGKKLDEDGLEVSKERKFDAWRKHYANAWKRVQQGKEDDRQLALKRARLREEALRAWGDQADVESLAAALRGVPPPWEEDPPRRPGIRKSTG